MINLNYLIKFLDEKQLKIKKDIYDNINDFEKSDYENVYEEKNKYKVEKYKLDLPNSLNILKNIDHFYYDNKYYKNKSPIFTLLNSIFCITDEFFNLNDEYSKEEIIKIFIKKMDDDLFNKNLYNKFNYNKNRKFNKYSIQEVLQNAYFFKYCDKFDLFKEYVSDYLGINIIIFKIENKNLNIENSMYFMTKYFGDNYNKYLPTFLLILENEIYKPLLLKEKDDKETSIIKYSIFNDLIDNIWKIFNIQELNNEINHEINDEINHEFKNEINHEIKNKINHELNNEINHELNNEINHEIKNEINHEIKNEINHEIKNEINNKIYNIHSLNKMKMEELNELCNKHNISIYKVSEKTLKNIKKLKIELINDLLNI